jgi:hypothetical protein
MNCITALIVTIAFVVHAPAQVVVKRQQSPTPFGQRFWHLPVEVMASEAERPTMAPWPLEVFEADDGTQGYFIFSKNRTLQFRLRKLDGSWQVIDYPRSLPSSVTQQTKLGLFLTTGLEDNYGRIYYNEVNLWDGSKHRVTDIPKGSAPSDGLLFPRLVVDGDDRHALSLHWEGHIVFATSADSGAKWTPLKVIARNSLEKDQICPPLIASRRGLHVVHVAGGGVLTQIMSDDNGANWKLAKAQPNWDDRFGEAMLTNGYGVRDVIHICTVTKEGNWIFHASNDAGASWSDGVQIASCKPSLYSSMFHVRGNGKATVLCYTEPGDHKKHAHVAHFLATNDGGKTWSEMPVVDGVRGDTGRPIVHVNHRGRMLSMFVKGPVEGDDDDHDYVVLMRSFAAIDKARAMSGAQRVPVRKLAEQLVGADEGGQSDAKNALVGMGPAVVPVLMDVTAQAKIGQKTEQISALIREIQLSWHGQSKAPSWWVGSGKEK